jgi:hypothetical protein
MFFNNTNIAQYFHFLKSQKIKNTNYEKITELINKILIESLNENNNLELNQNIKRDYDKEIFDIFFENYQHIFSNSEDFIQKNLMSINDKQSEKIIILNKINKDYNAFLTTKKRLANNRKNFENNVIQETEILLLNKDDDLDSLFFNNINSISNMIDKYKCGLPDSFNPLKNNLKSIFSVNIESFIKQELQNITNVLKIFFDIKKDFLCNPLINQDSFFYMPSIYIPCQYKKIFLYFLRLNMQYIFLYQVYLNNEIEEKLNLKKENLNELSKESIIKNIENFTKLYKEINDDISKEDMLSRNDLKNHIVNSFQKYINNYIDMELSLINICIKLELIYLSKNIFLFDYFVYKNCLNQSDCNKTLIFKTEKIEQEIKLQSLEYSAKVNNMVPFNQNENNLTNINQDAFNVLFESIKNALNHYLNLSCEPSNILSNKNLIECGLLTSPEKYKV